MIKNITDRIDIIFVLSLIFMEGNRMTEEDLTQNVERWEMLAQLKHTHFVEVWKFITKDLVWGEYLKYQQIPNDDPVHYEFLWDPQTHAETSKMKVLMHVAQFNRADLKSYPELYEEALEAEIGIESESLRER
ncbi:Melanoma-associated antigen B4 [Fukomys damarensis]|uniref:Melanoma-associated antigen B4 n=1 Tax=Fukomys damarensis TaxID=885580 RepID=A0A091D9D9_FUKDA|nr:Melanoma-associated antigen B4 [Fukomys damarensis]